MKHKNLLSAIVIFSFGLIISCNKKSSDPQPGTTGYTGRIDSITANTWKLTKMHIEPGYDTTIFGVPVTITEVYPYLPACQKDNTYKFNRDSSYVVSDGPSVCSPPDGGTGKWYFNSSQTVITTVLNGTTTNFTINELTTKKFVATSSQAFTYNGKNYKATPTFEPK